MKDNFEEKAALGSFDIRWELEAFGGGMRLTLWTNQSSPKPLA